MYNFARGDTNGLPAQGEHLSVPAGQMHLDPSGIRVIGGVVPESL
ncbi:MAG: hypothetical protein O2967_18350 [Proteobacteria bacterium]|nr:hypothetical protein [Pseudomonadota bacterium]